MRIFFLIFLIVCLFIPFSYGSGLEINIAKESYSVKETFQAKIIVDNIEENLKASQIKLINQNGANFQITPFLYKIGDNYYVYFQIPFQLEAGNYSIMVKDVVYYENNNLRQGNFYESFSIVSKHVLVYVDPGIIIANDIGNKNSFDFRLVNYGDGIFVSLYTDTPFISVSEDSLMLNGDKTVEIYVSDYLKNFDGTKNLNVDYENYSYTIPIWFGPSAEDANGLNESNQDDNNETVTEEKLDVRFLNSQNYLNLTTNRLNSKFISIEFKNFGETEAKNIKFYLEGDISSIGSLEYIELDKLSSGEISTQKIYLNTNKDALGFYSGKMVMDYGSDKTEEYYIYAYFLEGSIEDKSNAGKSVKIRNESEINENDSNKTKINYWIIFVFFVLALIIATYFLYHKYKKSMKESSFPLSS